MLKEHHTLRKIKAEEVIFWYFCEINYSYKRKISLKFDLAL
jgi:hypothetical protein